MEERGGLGVDVERHFEVRNCVKDSRRYYGRRHSFLLLGNPLLTAINLAQEPIHQKTRSREKKRKRSDFQIFNLCGVQRRLRGFDISQTYTKLL